MGRTAGGGGRSGSNYPTHRPGGSDDLARALDTLGVRVPRRIDVPDDGMGVRPRRRSAGRTIPLCLAIDADLSAADGSTRRRPAPGNLVLVDGSRGFRASLGAMADRI